MNGGHIARFGFHFQDSAAVWLMLREYLQRIFTNLSEGSISDLRIGVEAVSKGDSPTWDVVLHFDKGHRVVYEVKSGQITKEDKTKIFWSRVRREVKGNPGGLKVGWIVEKEDGEAFIEKVNNLKKNAVELTKADIPQKNPDVSETNWGIRSWRDLRDSALYWLCAADMSDCDLLTIDEAKKIISEIETIVLNQEELFSEVDRLLNAFFPNAFSKDVLGQLNNELLQLALSATPEAKSITELLTKAELIFGDEMSLKAYTFLKQNWAESASLRNYENPPETHRVKYVEIDHPILENAKVQLKSITQKNMVITGHAGVGKSVLMEAIFKNIYKTLPVANNHGIPNTICVKSIHMLSSSDSTDILINAARSISYLGNSLMVVDGLDDLPDDSLEKLSIELSKLSEYENLSIIISCRDEVFNNSAKLQTLRENLGFGVINLESWDEKAIEHIILDEVAKDRIGTLSTELIAILTTPFFLDIFLDICALDEKLKPDSDLFRVKNSIELLEKYKCERITSNRAIDIKGHNDPDARIKTCSIISKLVLDNHLVFDKSVHVGSVDGLLVNGVLISTPGNRVAFRHRLLQDYIVADSLMGDIDFKPYSEFSKVYDSIMGVRSVAIRNGIIQMFAAILFNTQRDDIFANRILWLIWLDKKCQDSEGDVLYSTTITMWSRLSPLDYPLCDPNKWPDTVNNPTESMLMSLLNDISALPERGLNYLTNQWWEHAVFNWGEKCQIRNPKIVLTTVKLVNAVFNSVEESVPDIENACNKLIAWSTEITDQLSELNGHYQLVDFVCKKGPTIPYEWVIDQARPKLIMVRETVVENIHKLIPLERMGDALIRAYGVARQEDKKNPPVRWFFTDQINNERLMMDYYLLKGLKSSDIINIDPLNLIKAIASIIDAHRYMEERTYNENKNEIFEDHSDMWYWKQGSRHPDHMTSNELADMILAALINAAKKDNNILFVSTKKILYEASDIMLFRTLISDALYQNRNLHLEWHNNEWIEILTDCRLYSSYSMCFWLQWGISSFFEKFSIQIQSNIIECIVSLSDKPTLQEEYLALIKDNLSSLAPHLFEKIKQSDYWMKQVKITHPSEIAHNSNITELPREFVESEYLKGWEDHEDIHYFRTIHEIVQKINKLIEGIESLENDKVENEIYPQIHGYLQNTVEPMNNILSRKDKYLANSYPLWWACTILENIRRVVYKNEILKEKRISTTEKGKLDKQYLALLDKYAPWILEASVRALATFKEPSLSINLSDLDDFNGSYGMPDPWICSVSFWDLAIFPPMQVKLSAFDEEMQDVILKISLPEKMRMFLIFNFRTYNLCHRKKLHDMLWEWLKEAKNAKLITWYLEPFCHVFPSKRIDMMKMIMAKENIIGDQRDLNYYFIGLHLSACWYRTDLQSENELIGEFSDIAEQVINGEIPKPQSASVITSFSSHLVHVFRTGLIENPVFCNLDRLAEGFSRLIGRHFLLPTEEGEYVRSNGSEMFFRDITHCFELPKELDISKLSISRDDIWNSLKPSILWLIERSDLAGLSELLFLLSKDSANDDYKKLEIPPDWTNALDIIEAAVDRISQFQKTGMITTDYGYIGTLNGIDHVKFIKELLKHDRLNKPIPGSDDERRLNQIISRLDVMRTPNIYSLKQIFL